jgi:hypothetical protein
MRSILAAGVAVSILSLAAASVPAAAFPIDTAPKAGPADIVKVQFKRRFVPGGSQISGPGSGFAGGGGMAPRGGGFGGGNAAVGGQHFGGNHNFAGGGFRGGRGDFHRRGFGVGAGLAGLAAGAVIGGAIANSQYPNYGYDYGYAAPVYEDAAPVYADPGPVYAEGGPVGGDDEGYCARRYRSYDPASGTYLGFDGLRHPCP